MKKYFLLFLSLLSLKLFSQKIIVSTGIHELYAIDILNCKQTFLNNTGFYFQDISYTTDGRLWGISEQKLYQIDTLTYIPKYIGTTGVIHSTTLIELDDSTLITNEDDSLYQLNVNTLSRVNMGGFDKNYRAMGDLTWYNNELYMSCSIVGVLDQKTSFMRIKLSADKKKITSSEIIGKTEKDLHFLGLITTSLPGEHTIIGFAENDVYKICHQDGTIRKICSLIPSNKSFVLGAAAMKVNYPITDTTSCSYAEPQFFIPNVFTPNNDGINDFWTLPYFHTLTTLQIFNQWGKKVNDLEISPKEIYKWDGGDCNSGVYYYIITVSDKIYSGCLSLLR